MKRFVDILRNNWDVIVVFACMTAIFTHIMFNFDGNSGDLIGHAKAVMRRASVGGPTIFAGNFLLYLIANVLTLFSGNRLAIWIALPLIIALCNTAKYVIVGKAFAIDVDKKAAKSLSLALLLVYVVPLAYLFHGLGEWTQHWYMGYIVPNIWHNSTLICMMPFAIVAYLQSVRQLQDYSPRRTVYISIALILSILVKPSFFFVYATVFPFVYLVRYRLNKEFFRLMLPILCGAIIVLYEYITIGMYYPKHEGDGMIISFARIFTLPFWETRWLTWLISLFFPMLFAVLYRKEIYKDLEFYALVGMLIVALGIYMCCQETGYRAFHGNFAWQMYAVMWFVYFYILKKIVHSIQTMYPHLTHIRWSGIAWREKIMCSLYALHVASGVVYLLHYLITRNYL